MLFGLIWSPNYPYFQTHFITLHPLLSNFRGGIRTRIVVHFVLKKGPGSHSLQHCRRSFSVTHMHVAAIDKIQEVVLRLTLLNTLMFSVVRDCHRGSDTGVHVHTHTQQYAIWSCIPLECKFLGVLMLGTQNFLASDYKITQFVISTVHAMHTNAIEIESGRENLSRSLRLQQELCSAKLGAYPDSGHTPVFFCVCVLMRCI